MKRAIALIKRHPLGTFFVLAYLLSWWPQLVGGDLFPFGPLLATLIVAALSGGRAGLSAWWQFVTRWRSGLGWYALAILLPFALNGVAAGLAVLLGAPVPSTEKIAAWPELLITFPLYLIAFGPLGEEPGWRGFALPRLLPGRSALLRSLSLACFVAVWHLPLVVGGQQPASILLAVMASQVIYTWLANRSGISVLIVMLAHAAQGGLGGAYFGPMFSGTAAVLETNLLAAVHCIVAVVIVGLAGLQLGQPTEPQDPAARSAHSFAANNSAG